MKEKTKRPLDISDLLIETCFALLSSIHNRIEAAAATRQSYRNDNYVLSELDSAAISLRDNVWWDV